MNKIKERKKMIDTVCDMVCGQSIHESHSKAIER